MEHDTHFVLSDLLHSQHIYQYIITTIMKYRCLQWINTSFYTQLDKPSNQVTFF